MKVIYKEEKGVSPVIATILMVAITVVLAATVYLMVSGYFGGSTKPPIAGIFFQNSISVSETNLTLSMSTPASATPTLVVFAIDGSKATYNSGASSYGGVDYWTGGTITNPIEIVWYDVDGSGTITPGDVFLVVNTVTGHSVAGTVVTMTIPTVVTGSVSITIS